MNTKHEVRAVQVANGVQLRLFPENYLIAGWDCHHLRWLYEFDLGIPMILAVSMFAVAMTYSGRHDSDEVVVQALNTAIRSVEG